MTTRREFLRSTVRLTACGAALGTVLGMKLAKGSTNTGEPPYWVLEEPYWMPEVFTGLSWGAHCTSDWSESRQTSRVDSFYMPTEVYTPRRWEDLKAGDLVRFRGKQGEIDSSGTKKEKWIVVEPAKRVPGSRPGTLTWSVSVARYDPSSANPRHVVIDGEIGDAR
jgi:hypothetical protein